MRRNVAQILGLAQAEHEAVGWPGSLAINMRRRDRVALAARLPDLLVTAHVHGGLDAEVGLKHLPIETAGCTASKYGGEQPIFSRDQKKAIRTLAGCPERDRRITQLLVDEVEPRRIRPDRHSLEIDETAVSICNREVVRLGLLLAGQVGFIVDDRSQVTPSFARKKVIWAISAPVSSIIPSTKIVVLRLRWLHDIRSSGSVNAVPMASQSL